MDASASLRALLERCVKAVRSSEDVKLDKFHYLNSYSLSQNKRLIGIDISDRIVAVFCTMLIRVYHFLIINTHKRCTFVHLGFAKAGFVQTKESQNDMHSYFLVHYYIHAYKIYGFMVATKFK